MTIPVQQHLKRIELEIDPVDLTAWLWSRPEEPKFFWSDREGRFARAGAGCVDRIRGDSLNDLPDAFRWMRQRLNFLQSLRLPSNRGSKRGGEGCSYFGGIAFNDRCCGREWEGFGAYDFILPKVEIIQSDGKTILVVHSADENVSDEDVDFWKQSLDIKSSADEHYQMLSKMESPGFETWEKTLSRVVDDLDAQVYQKIVLSRCIECRMDQTVNPWLVLERLMAHQINSYAFAWMPDHQRAYIGATPERLFKRSGSRIESEAVAGTKPRGKNAEDDLLMEKNLLRSLKNESEHRFVVEYILKAFRQLCREHSYDKTIQLLKLTDNQHLLTRFQGLLKENMKDEDIIRALHPTPAVGGFSRESAAAKILSYETINRGWFTGLIGTVGREESEFAVAIRSGLIRGDQVYLYGGAGIVEGSEAQDEWDEIDGKMAGWMKVLQE